MKSHTDCLWFTTKKRREILNITSVLAGQVEKSGVREGFAAHGKKFKIHMASPLLCTDNGVMIAVAGYYKHCHAPRKHEPEPLSVDSTLAIESWG